MPRQAALVLTATAVARMIREAAAPARDVADGQCPGLTLRLTPTAATWSVRFRHDGKPLRIKLGDAGAWSLAQARSVAVDVRRHVEAGHGEPDPAWIELKRAAMAARGEEAAAVPAYMPRERAPETWTYGEARAAWREWMQREAAAGGLRDATVRNYSGVVGGPAMRALDARYISRIEAPDVAAVVEILVAEGKRSTAKDVVRVTRRFWDWLAEPAQVRRSGAKPGVMAGLKAPKLGSTKLRRHFPLVPEIAHMLAVAQHGVLSDSVGMAIELLSYTAQRRLSVVKARVDEFEPWPARPDWGLWWQGHRKIARGSPTAEEPRRGAHALPLPPHVWWRVQAYLRRTTADAVERGGERSEWMFPAGRPRRFGDPVSHLAEDTLTHAVAAMPGRRASPHDVRRAFATVLQRDHNVSAATVGMVLDHANSDLLQVVDGNGMTRRYTGDQMLELKAPALSAWTEALVAARRDVELPDSLTLKAALVAENLRQRGIRDPAAEAERRRKASAKAWAEGRTTRQRRRAQASETGASKE
ncbi:integrase family protein [Methylobacterium sp. C25]|uniref:integrase family protein n=1 Tax=Methylobacterium sp. C25 TaxID=2721622 RepID=UPI001F3EE5B5|nr:integrase family protein [Methylobacterium sp. C25]MCE4224045.1 integrase family protein [Methylobacterium sp. C25]